MKQILAVFIIFLIVPLTAVAQDACEGNFDCDQDVDGSDAAVFKEDFGRSPFSNPCPNCPPPALVPKTGQTTSYATGDDGDLEKGVAWPNARFTDNSDGTVTDNLTGLIWLKNANCFGTRTWNNALSDANGLASGSCGLTDGSSAGDWRLPNSNELASLVHKGYDNPAIPNTEGTGQWSEGDPFTCDYWGNFCFAYWSSTTSSINTDRAWMLYSYYGEIYYEEKTNDYYVWPVRDPL